MSKLDELIQEYCPDGVEYKELHTVLKIKNGKDYKSLGEGDIPVYGSGGIMTYVDSYAYDKPSVLIPRKGSLDKLYYVDTPFWNVDTIFYTEINTAFALPRYIFHCLLREHLEKLNTAGGVPSLTQKVLNTVKIPVPPLPVQEEIVRILDRFSRLTTDLIEALQTELQLRKKQYEYYRTTLLECTDINSTILPIPEFANTFIGLVTTMTKHYVREGVPLIHNSSIKENRFEFKEHVYLDYEFAEKNKSKRHKKGDVITVHTGDVGTSAIIQDDLDGSLGFATIVSRIEDTDFVLPEWLCHCLNSKLCKNQISGMIKGDRNNLNLKDFNKLVIPIPSIAEQKRIIEILDRFDALCNDLSSGIPAEIEARKKQYEYYRDKLLNFKPLSSKN